MMTINSQDCNWISYIINNDGQEKRSILPPANIMGRGYHCVSLTFYWRTAKIHGEEQRHNTSISTPFHFLSYQGKFLFLHADARVSPYCNYQILYSYIGLLSLCWQFQWSADGFNSCSRFDFILKSHTYITETCSWYTLLSHHKPHLIDSLIDSFHTSLNVLSQMGKRTEVNLNLGSVNVGWEIS